jgi:hypothetical protein
MRKEGSVNTHLHLRQICLAAPHLEPVVSDIAAIMGLDVCYRDPQVGKYGLENALLPVDTILLEVVAPTREGTAAGRFLQKTGGHGGYMAIFACDDPDARALRANALGVRTANVIDHPPYHGVQLHPRDCRGAFIEFNHTEGSDDVSGPYPPAGPDWQHAIRRDVTKSLTEIELQSPRPAELARHWGSILDIKPCTDVDGRPQLDLPNGRIRFVQGPGTSEIISGLTFAVTDREQVLGSARARGHAIAGDKFLLCGVTFSLAA